MFSPVKGAAPSDHAGRRETAAADCAERHAHINPGCGWVASHTVVASCLTRSTAPNLERETPCRINDPVCASTTSCHLPQEPKPRPHSPAPATPPAPKPLQRRSVQRRRPHRPALWQQQCRRSCGWRCRRQALRQTVQTWRAQAPRQQQQQQRLQGQQQGMLMSCRF